MPNKAGIARGNVECSKRKRKGHFEMAQLIGRALKWDKPLPAEKHAAAQPTTAI
jgi:hypothetical protein